MPSDLSAVERAYRRLKTDILDGKLPPGPLDIRMLGDRLRMSATPVREALARLGVERHVQLTPYQGYIIAHPSARSLQHLYELNGALLDFSLHLLENSAGQLRRPNPDTQPTDYAVGVTGLLREITASQPNLELSQRVSEAGDRLLAARRCEPAVFSGAMESLVILRALWREGDLHALKQLMRCHHDARASHADALARALTEPDPRN